MKIRSRHVARFATLLVLVGLPGCTRAQAEGEPLPAAKGEGAPAGPEVPTLASLDEERKVQSLRFVGSLLVKDRVEVAAEMGGTLAEVRNEVGDTVKKGDVLFRLKGSSARLGLRRTKTGLAAAKQQLATAQTNLERIQQLYDAGATTKATLDQALSAHEAATIGVQDAELAVDVGSTSMADTTTRSPIDGIITEKRKNAGEAVASMPPTVVVVVEDRAVLELRFRVPEQHLSRLPPGTELEAEFAALGSKRTVKVSRHGQSVDPLTRTIEVICDIDNADGSLKPGMSAEVTAGTAA